MATKTKLEELRASLRIDKDRLDECLMEQPDLYYHVSDEYEQGTINRDRIKLDLDELEADLDVSIRKVALEREEKLTEPAIAKRIASAPPVKALNRKLLDARAAMGQWKVLKDSYEQRAASMKEMVALELMRWRDLGVERGAVSSRNRLVDQAVEQQMESRRGMERYRGRGEKRNG